jgi:hypothetical protein
MSNFEPHGSSFVCVQPYDASKTIANLPPGSYSYVPPGMMNPPEFRVRSHSTDNLIEFKSGVARTIIEDVNKFLSPEVRESFKRYGYIHRRGLLVHGKPGSGKSCVFQQIAKHLIETGGVVLNDVRPDNISNAIALIRRGNKDQTIMIVLEEFEDLIRNWEATLLQLMDGSNTVPNVLWLASTNYIDKIPDRFKVRPSRFARVIRLNAPGKEVRRQYAETFLKPEDLKRTDLDKLVSSTKGLVLDQLKDVLISMVCFDLSMEDAVGRVSGNAGTDLVDEQD